AEADSTGMGPFMAVPILAPNLAALSETCNLRKCPVKCLVCGVYCGIDSTYENRSNRAGQKAVTRRRPSREAHSAKPFRSGARRPAGTSPPVGTASQRRARPPGLLATVAGRCGSAGLGIGGHVAGRIARGQIARGEVRLYQFATPGKTPDKKRPALVLTRNSAIAYLSTVTVAPVTSTIRGVPSEVVLNEEDGMKSPCAVNLHNAVTVSQQRLGKRVAQLNSARMNEVCAALRFSLGCDSN